MKILITGITGQCGSIAARHFLNHGHEVYGMVRRTSTINTLRLTDILDKITLIHGDLTDLPSLIDVVEASNPDIVLNLASQSFVHVSWKMPLLTADVTGLGAIRMLEAVKCVNKNIKFIQASSSEQYGLVTDDKPLDEHSSFYPRSPYACAKVYSYYACVNYRESYNMWISCAIMFNYESEWRSPEFVTRKITKAAARIKLGLQNKLQLGNIHAKRDWSYCGDTVKALHLMMNQEIPNDYVIASGETHSVEEFCSLVFTYLGLDYTKYVEIDPNLFRPTEVPMLLGNATKIKNLGWKPEVSLKELVKIMVDADLERCKLDSIF